MQPADAHSETDLADLAARFSAQSGGGLSPELSADLALEVVLNEIVEQACLATGATGAAIVLQRDGEMVCRASSGANAPQLGSRLDSASGLSGECIRTRQTQWCDDVLTDPRADTTASQRLGVRSLMIMPIVRGAELLGVFELFSSLPYSFGERDERTVEALIARTVRNLDRANLDRANLDRVQGPVEPENDEEQRVSEYLGSSLDLPQESPEHASEGRSEIVTWVLGIAVLGCAILLGLLLGRHLGPQKARVRAPAPVAPAAANTSSVATSAASTSGKDEHGEASTQPPNKTVVNSAVPAGGLVIFENGKEVFRMPPGEGEATPSSAGQGSETRPASSAAATRLVLSPAAAERSLLHRVEPEYPVEARQQQVQGAVALVVSIAADGSVEDASVVSGPPQLARAAIDAVKQWRFRPHLVNGSPVEMETKITLNFRLPQ